jgi:dGTPase
MINRVVTDLIETSAAAIAAADPADIDAVRELSDPLIGFSDDISAEHQELKRYLRDHVYRHYRVLRMTNKARRVITGLFDAFTEDPRLLPPDYVAEDPPRQPRLIAHYIAGMTDRYALKEYQRLFVINDN